MLDTAIIGGGLSGLALAFSLRQQGRVFALYEARERLGGRILTVSADSIELDLGPAWYWPASQPRITQLVAELGLVAYPQHDQGIVLNLTDPEKSPQPYPASSGVHGGARRLVGGMGSLVQALADNLPADELHTGHVLYAVIEHGDYVELQFRCGESMRKITARQVVLAVPPRVLEEHVRFEPPLGESMRQSMCATYTWMADQAKVVVTYPHSFWRKAGLAGNAFVEHGQSVLYETFDACNADADQAALGGFIALTPAQRRAYRFGMPLLISSQLVQLFGTEADNGKQHIQDWAAEVYTSSTLDQNPPARHPAYDDPSLRRSFWKAKLYFCGSETAGYAAGYLEGALEASERVSCMLAVETCTVIPIPEVPAEPLRNNL
ncbi:MAG TPA: NAD(P)/FAD-dependent oxidoreductase [Gallionella sp.]|nr:NAD(P)/FAD-dependent oxidoreductase [Gallionella sp.]